jgi:hypothetical protein
VTLIDRLVAQVRLFLWCLLYSIHQLSDEPSQFHLIARGQDCYLMHEKIKQHAMTCWGPTQVCIICQEEVDEPWSIIYPEKIGSQTFVPVANDCTHLCAPISVILEGMRGVGFTPMPIADRSLQRFLVNLRTPFRY